jgi:aryl-alcohol dehydrogenase-like predicted oxidoreductase
MNTDIVIGSATTQPLVVKRFGYGTMRLTGEGIYGEPPNRPEALAILKEAVAAGVNFLDTADYYGEDVTNRLIREALYPYSDDLVICTKVGATRKPDKSWIAYNSPAHLRLSIENNLRTLGLEQLKLVHFRVMPGSEVPFDESMAAMYELQAEGKILHVGISNVNPGDVQIASTLGDIATIENLYGHGQRTTITFPHGGENRGGEEVLDFCNEQQIPLVPYFSLLTGLPKNDTRMATVAKKYNISVAQANLAWLLHRSPWILPIPGTSSLLHFRENMKATEIQFTQEDMTILE